MNEEAYSGQSTSNFFYDKGSSSYKKWVFMRIMGRKIINKDMFMYFFVLRFFMLFLPLILLHIAAGYAFL